MAHCSFCLKEDHASAACPCILLIKSPASNQKLVGGSHAAVISCPNPTNRQLAGDLQEVQRPTLQVSSLPLLLCLPACCVADHTPSMSAGHSNVRGANHRVAIGARARWPNGTESTRATQECPGYHGPTSLVVTVYPDGIIGCYR